MRTPQRLQGIYFDYQIQNESGVGDFIVAAKESNASDWATCITYTTTQASLSDVADQYIDLSAWENPTRIGWFVVPGDGASEIPSSATITDDIEVRNLDRLELFVDTTSHSALVNSLYSVGAEAGIYDMQTTLRLGGGVDPDTPYDLIEIGGEGHWLHLDSGYELWIQTDPDTTEAVAAVYNSSAVLQYRAPWSFVAKRYELNIDGTGTPLVSRSFMPLKPAINLLGTAEDRVTGWTLANGSGVSSTIANASTPTFDGNSQSIRWNFTVTPVGAWTATITSGLIALTPGQIAEFGMAAYRSSMAATIVATMDADWRSGVSGSVQTNDSLARTLTTNTTWYTFGAGDTAYVGSESDDPTDGVIISITISDSGSMTGDVYLDMITLGPPVLHVAEEEMGTLTIDVLHTEGFHG
jgi:hypothetical protein